MRQGERERERDWGEGVGGEKVVYFYCGRMGLFYLCSVWSWIYPLLERGRKSERNKREPEVTEQQEAVTQEGYM